VVPWRTRTRRSWRRRHRTRTTLEVKNLWPVSVENHYQTNFYKTSYKTLYTREQGEGGFVVLVRCRRLQDVIDPPFWKNFVLSGSLSFQNDSARRHGSLTENAYENSVLRKVASLTLEGNSAVDLKLSKPKLTPEKLDFHIYEKFEGELPFIINLVLGQKSLLKN